MGWPGWLKCFGEISFGLRCTCQSLSGLEGEDECRRERPRFFSRRGEGRGRELAREFRHLAEKMSGFSIVFVVDHSSGLWTH